jgi:hypothetical protein
MKLLENSWRYTELVLDELAFKFLFPLTMQLSDFPSGNMQVAECTSLNASNTTYCPSDTDRSAAQCSSYWSRTCTAQAQM